MFYSLEAEDDLAEITAYYLAESGTILAERILLQITERIASLSHFPYRTLASQKVIGTREFKITGLPYNVFLVIEEAHEQIKVLRVLHTSRLFPNS
ncbi:type II toxin-antitoxin system RelE/ParE family toxin [Testudinibacter sp. TR-2022]|uniref:type II toxin-antitoxin system RelE/ParE family toxin n=1 Tax=Testudinibacter sp. TR-2022 TaxID=2585029 RepID=UPI001117B048|nr:type II toxin-antitoxin system RelE/ParE family toxin [Testudinibacter sp. TR-2022]TNH08318.1 type II toxin-antitoxin system RelE/ParE family toxin [Pasteurellaceae bacterium Phil11]TNH25404.1 type II toxin-antitoxin system RelE/ParE family toxin [Testudinibacter sp. TR-2022]TNH27521.1 type II toxin-antitoxin system RelE/ParE family toxin [Testudinibacter sp. TR-2022]